MAAEYNTEAEQIDFDNQLEAELEIWAQLNEAQRRMNKAWQQIVVLNRKIQDLYKRYQDASAANQRGIKYSLEMKLTTTVGVGTAYYYYAMQKAEEIHELQSQLRVTTEEEEADTTWEYGSDVEEMDQSD